MAAVVVSCCRERGALSRSERRLWADEVAVASRPGTAECHRYGGHRGELRARTLAAPPPLFRLPRLAWGSPGGGSCDRFCGPRSAARRWWRLSWLRGFMPKLSGRISLFIFSDDHAYQAIGAYGFGLNKTPNIDRIAAEGMRFNRCLTTNSLCGPSRACVLTGKYSISTAFINNYGSCYSTARKSPFPSCLQKAGYQTAIFGKWHLVSDPTGFDYWEILPGQGQYYNPPMILNGRGTKKHGLRDRHHRGGLRSIGLRTSAIKSKPFLLMCAQQSPAPPLAAGARSPGGCTTA